jgi:hypothetical protein
MTTMRRFVLLGLLLAAPSHAQVLHERVTVGTLTCADGICKGAGSSSTRAIEQDGQVYYPPAQVNDAQPKPGEQIFTPQPERPVEVGGSGQPQGGGDAPPDRRDAIRSDRDTGPEGPGKRFYHVVFNPDPFPYKRMTALDTVRITPCPDGRPDCDDEVLEVLDRTKYALPVLGAAQKSADRDAFWGSIVIDLEPGRWVPIPSVAPESRILEYTAAPDVPMEFAHDGGDNLFVRSTAGGRHRLTWLSDAPQRYFAGELPQGVRMSEMPRSLLRTAVLPDRLRARVLKVLAHIGMKLPSKSATVESVLFPLVNYFRAFEVGDMPPPTGSSYYDLAMAQKGCCRHRSFAFAITAMAVGLPVRYVENEVHVFVEVYVPRMGWRRVNLGGAPIDEEIVGGDGKSVYKEKGGDPFPQPAPFVSSAGAAPKGLAEMSKSSSGDGGKEPGGKGNGNGSSGNGSSGNGAGARSAGPPTVDLNAVEGADAQAEAARKPSARRAKTHLTIALAEGSSFRGETVEVSGVAAVDGADPGGLPIEIYLDHGGSAVKVGEALTDGNGRYRASIEVPKDLPLGDHKVIARCKGDDKRAPSSTRRP